MQHATPISFITLLHPAQGPKNSLALLLLRLLIGVGIVFHALGKLPNPASFMGDMYPAWVQGTAFGVELSGGILLTLGLLTPVAGMALFFIMLGALQYHFSMGHPFIGAEHTYEAALFYAVGALFLALQGGGRYALDTLLFCANHNKN